jgi:hypothetical protein
MHNSFSKRQGLASLESIKPDEMTDDLRNRLWNIIKDYIDKEFRGNYKRDDIIEHVWDNFYKQDKDKLKSWTSYI